VRKVFESQLAKATTATGEVDIDALRQLVVAAYEQADQERSRTERSISRMVHELDLLNRELGRQVEERTATLREREEELRAQNLRFDTALSNMSQALLLFDAAGRLVISNHRYCEMYGLSPDEVKPGCTVQELVSLRTRNRQASEDHADYIASLKSAAIDGRTLNRLLELQDGRTIAVVLTPMAGGGWVVTHEDITEQRRAEKQIAHMARHDALTDLHNR
jgi:PAS domain S-box-containing protein